VLICAGLVKTRLRRTSASPQRAYRVPGGIVMSCLGCVGAPLMLALSFYQSCFPPEWTILLIWTALGALFWLVERPIRSSISEEGRRELILGK
jgi:amino acid transporter